ncbi:sensor histidine kinase [Pararhodospirillum oryzae]|uniref:histidine kinase n=1 Tax=Pararhodospirillum oryzae TaxID=478448 RepID=A0A512HBC6_9PROT|nr:ATP-binding protein [Pararhodospirillum oryzae]GEO82754.1 ATPase [Pararhodospirillum oryzae]
MISADDRNDVLVFQDETADHQPDGAPQAEPWLILIADDDPEVHAITRTVLQRVRFKNRPLRLLSAHSEAESRDLLAQTPDLAVAVLDVVMEHEDSGLRLVRYIRETLGNRMVRLVLRTGQPGQAPERDLILNYEINDYKAKTELTANRLFTILIAALRAYGDLRELEESRAHLQGANALLEQRVAERTAALARSNAELESFAYGISHDLQEPLRMVHSYLTLIERRLAPVLEQEITEYLGFAQDGARRMSAMITDLLEYSRLTGRPPGQESVALSQVWKRALASLTLALAESKARVDLPETDAHVRGDEGQLARLFQNLFDNAIKHHRAAAPPHIVVRLAWADPPDRPAWRIEVADNGPGIPVSAADTVFALFRRLDGQSPAAGSGVGLALCRRIAELHNGRLWLAPPTPGTGARFCLVLPAPPGGPAPPGQPGPPAPITAP